MVTSPSFAALFALHDFFEARVFREHSLSYCVGRFADDSIVGDCVVCERHLSAFARPRKADYLFDYERKVVHGAFADSTIASMDFAQ